MLKYSLQRLALENDVKVKKLPLIRKPERKGGPQNVKFSNQSVTPLLLVDASQLLPDVLVRGVEGSVDFLREETVISDGDFIRDFIQFLRAIIQSGCCGNICDSCSLLLFE